MPNPSKHPELCTKLAEKTANTYKTMKTLNNIGKHTISLIETHKTKLDFHYMVEKHFLEKNLETCFQNCEMELCIGYLISHNDFGELLSNFDAIY